MQATPTEILRRYWGHEAFRSSQEEVILSVLAGKDTLALLPTGGGKSVCFQVPALMQEGVCVVVSPLVALMKDQVENLQSRGIDAVAVYSGMSSTEIGYAFDKCAYGNYKFLYLSPERLATETFLLNLAKLNVNLLAIDEAHCISQWGYDFRPEYLRIADFRAVLPTKVPLLALTATATAEVVEDIQVKLNFRQKNVFKKSFARKNLSYSVLYEENKTEKLIEIAQKVSGTGIVYSNSRKNTEVITDFLRKNKIVAEFYHAGLSAEERSRKQAAFLQNRYKIMVCTNAFGMGIDKPDVRFVVHLAPPFSLEAYFQEAGRAGRDGNRAYSVLLFKPSDEARIWQQFEQGFPSLQEVKNIYDAIGSHLNLAIGAGKNQSYPLNLEAFCHTFQYKPGTAYNALKILHRAGYLQTNDDVQNSFSRIHIVVDNMGLYRFQIAHKNYDALLQTLLRTYGGTFEGYVTISELKLASILKTDVSTIEKALLALQNYGIIDYIVRQTTPSIYYLLERLPQEYLRFSPEAYSDIKERQRQKLQGIVGYCNNVETCRSVQLLAYFDETTHEKCGVCDVCTGRNSAQISPQIYESIKAEILKYVGETPIKITDLMLQVKFVNRLQLTETLRLLIDEGSVQITENRQIYVEK